MGLLTAIVLATGGGWVSSIQSQVREIEQNHSQIAVDIAVIRQRLESVNSAITRIEEQMIQDKRDRRGR